jgi:hypothetical protein
VSRGFSIEVLSSAHDRKCFSCGAAALDRYFREFVTQDVNLSPSWISTLRQQARDLVLADCGRARGARRRGQE